MLVNVMILLRWRRSDIPPFYVHGDAGYDDDGACYYKSDKKDVSTTTTSFIHIHK